MGGQNARISKHSAAGRVGGGRGGRMEKERRVHIKTRTHQQESGGKNVKIMQSINDIRYKGLP